MHAHVIQPDSHKAEILGEALHGGKGAVLRFHSHGERVQVVIEDIEGTKTVLVPPDALLISTRLMTETTTPEATLNALNEVRLERARQVELWKGGNIPFRCDCPQVPHPSKLAALTEEVGEVAKEVNQFCFDLVVSPEAAQRLRSELIQTAAVAMAWAESIPVKGA